MRNQANGADMIGPHPGRLCFPYGAWRNLRATAVGGPMRYRARRLLRNRGWSEPISVMDSRILVVDLNRVRKVMADLSSN